MILVFRILSQLNSRDYIFTLLSHLPHHRHALSRLICADVPLRHYSLTGNNRVYLATRRWQAFNASTHLVTDSYLNLQLQPFHCKMKPALNTTYRSNSVKYVRKFL